MLLTGHDDLAKMVDGYLRAALWTWSDAEGHAPFGAEDDSDLRTIFPTEAIVWASVDCIAFLREVAEQSYFVTGEEGWPEAYEALVDMEPHQAGHDFWLTRERHGGGFWDRGLGAGGDRLAEAAKAYGDPGLSVEQLPGEAYEATFR
jgi:hypothetical protein